jgi:hypothetical protein
VRDLLNSYRTKHLAVTTRRTTAYLKVRREGVERVWKRKSDVCDDVVDVRDGSRDVTASIELGILIVMMDKG